MRKIDFPENGPNLRVKENLRHRKPHFDHVWFLNLWVSAAAHTFLVRDTFCTVKSSLLIDSQIDVKIVIFLEGSWNVFWISNAPKSLSG